MAALARSSLKIFTNTTLPSSKALLTRSEIHFLPSQKNVLVHFSRSLSLDHKTVRCLASSSSNTKVSTGLKTAESGIQAIETSKTVRIKFQLERQCLFGECFLLVGDDPIIGSWNSSQAIPLSWSEGHMWTVELDIPIGKTIQFKLILKQSTGDILWQPGPDRIFQTWETRNPITISEDWENAAFQKINDEQTVHHSEGLMTGSGMELNSKLMPNVIKDSMFSGNIAYPEEKSMVKRRKEFITAGYVLTEEPLSNESKEAYKVGFEKERLMSENSSRTSTDKNPESMEDKTYKFTYEEGPVLVPDLTPLQGMSTEAALSKESVKSIIDDASVDFDAAKDHNNLPEITS